MAKKACYLWSETLLDYITTGHLERLLYNVIGSWLPARLENSLWLGGPMMFRDKSNCWWPALSLFSLECVESGLSWKIPAAVFAMFPRKTSPRHEKGKWQSGSGVERGEGTPLCGGGKALGAPKPHKSGEEDLRLSPILFHTQPTSQ